MTFLTRLSLANRLIVGLVTLAIFVFGVLATLSLKQELLPNIQAPTAVITARLPGASPQIVAKEVSSPIGQAVAAVAGVTKVESTSGNGSAAITVQWEYGLDPDNTVSDIRNAVDATLPGLPSAVETEVLTGSTDDIPVLQLAVASDAELGKAGQRVDDVAVPALKGIEGVRQVTLTGENTTRLEVTLRPADLRERDLTAQAVTESIRAQAVVTPAGTSYDGSTELAVEVGESLGSVKQVQALPIATADGPVSLRRIADVKLESVGSSSIARSDGRPALSVSVLKDTDADAVEISHAVEDLLPGLEDRLGNNTTFTTVFDQAPLIEQSIHDLAVEGGLGLAFAVVIILLFLFSVRSTIITAISIPLSLLIAMIGLQLGDYSLNIFTLAALTVAIGRVVDDSIVVIENIKRRAAGQVTLTPADIIASVKEVSGAVTASTLTTVAVFLPVAVVSGVVGELFRPFAITVAVALAASLLVSMTIVPVLAFWFLRGGARSTAPRASGDVASGVEEERAVTRLQRGYLPVLRLGLRHPVLTVALAVVIFAGTLGSATLLKTDFLGSVSDQSTLQVTQELPAGVRLSATSRAAEQVEKVLAATPEVSGYLTTIGGGGAIAGPPGGASGSNTATITVTLPEGAKADTVRPILENKLGVLRKAGEITVAAANSGATNNDITVLVTGANSDVLRPAAEQVEKLLSTVDGLSDIRSNMSDQRKVLKVQVDLEKAADQGFTQAEVGQAVAGAMTGTQVGSVTLEGESRDILVRRQANGASPSDVANLELPVSQLQQQKAQERASDKLADKQEAQTDRAQAEADQAAADQRQELRDQREKAQDGLRDTREQLRRLKASPPPPPPAPDPTLPGVPVTTDTLAQQQYAQQLQQYNQQVAQLTASVEQTEKSLEQIDDQLAAAAEQAAKSAEQRQESEKLQDEQQALTDVRAQPIRVKDVARVVAVLAPTTVTQIDGTESVTITATPAAGNLGALSETIQQKLDAASDLPPGVTATLGGASQDQQDAFRQLGLAMLAAIVLVFLIMVATFHSLRQPLILLVSIPFAATGAIAALLVTGTPLGVPAMIGVLMLIGIVVTNAIVLIDLINQYRASGKDLQSAVVDGARLRLRPIIMTAAATVFALVPMGLGLTGGGAFISKPLAVVVIGGLVSSTVLTLLLVPVLYTLVERRGERAALAGRKAAAVPPA
jgi:multidrug efflux pump subunit AcrB